MMIFVWNILFSNVSASVLHRTAWSKSSKFGRFNRCNYSAVHARVAVVKQSASSLSSELTPLSNLNTNSQNRCTLGEEKEAVWPSKCFWNWYFKVKKSNQIHHWGVHNKKVHLLFSLASKSSHMFVELFWLDLCRFLSWFRPDHFITERSVIMN